MYQLETKSRTREKLFRLAIWQEETSVLDVVRSLFELAVNNPVPAIVVVVFAGWVVKIAAGPV